jgi:hypothetical protein
MMVEAPELAERPRDRGISDFHCRRSKRVRSSCGFVDHYRVEP